VGVRCRGGADEGRVDGDGVRLGARSGVGVGGGGVGAAAEAAATNSGYGSEPGYRGDVELGYGDEMDEEDEDGRQQLFWDGVIGGDKRL
jgi:hypothetical protein